MQVNTISVPELSDLLDESEILDMVDLGGIRMYVLDFDKQDVLVFSSSASDAFVVYPPESFDAESGGSIHDHARAILSDACNDSSCDNSKTDFV